MMRRPNERGFTMVELLAYLSIFTMFLGTVAGAEVAARRMNKVEGATLHAVYEVDRLFAFIAEDCDHATGVAMVGVPAKGSRQELIFRNGATYIAKGGEVLRNKRLVATDVHDVVFSRPDPVKYPRLLQARLTYRQNLADGQTFERTFERTFRIRNLEGDGRGF
jgi:hypothetical protein